MTAREFSWATSPSEENRLYILDVAEVVQLFVDLSKHGK